MTRAHCYALYGVFFLSLSYMYQMTDCVTFAVLNRKLSGGIKSALHCL